MLALVIVAFISCVGFTDDLSNTNVDALGIVVAVNVPCESPLETPAFPVVNSPFIVLLYLPSESCETFPV